MRAIERERDRESDREREIKRTLKLLLTQTHKHTHSHAHSDFLPLFPSLSPHPRKVFIATQLKGVNTKQSRK